MLKVKAIWRVGYPSGPDKKIYLRGDVFKCDAEWGKRKADQSKVEIIEEIKEEQQNPEPPELPELPELPEKKEPEIKEDTGTKTLFLEEKLEKYNQGYGWYEIPGVEQNVRKEEAIKILKEKM